MQCGLNASRSHIQFLRVCILRGWRRKKRGFSWRLLLRWGMSEVVVFCALLSGERRAANEALVSKV